MTPKLFVFAAIFLCFDLLRFTKGQRRGTVRLVHNGLTSTSYSSGRVQVYMYNWGYICDDVDFTITEADVICHQLGYSGALSHSRSAVDSYGVDSSYNFLMSDVDCSTSNYLVILQCSYSSFTGSCERNRDEVSVICSSTRIWDSPYQNQIRLSQGAYTSQGLVEVYCNGQWGTVCDDYFYQTEADTVCKQLGYTGAARYDNLTPRGSYNQPIWLDNVDCHSTHSCLRSCQTCPSYEHSDCSHTEDITVECEFESYSSSSTVNSTCDYDHNSLYNRQQRGTVRLVRNEHTSTSYSSGRVQVYMNNWGYICDDIEFNTTEADVICHQLGYSGALSYSKSSLDSYGVNSSYNFLMSEVDCSTSNYLVILQCSYSSFTGSCERNRDEVSVICYSTRIWDNPYQNQIRLSQGAYTSHGLVEVYCNGQWGTVCDDFFYQTEADTVCKQLGYTGAARYDNLTLRGNSSQPIWLDDVNCLNTQSCLRSCQTCPSHEHSNCYHFEDITVECEVESYSSRPTLISTCDYPEPLNGRAIACIVLGIIFPISALISIGACIGVALFVSRSRRNRHPVAYSVVDNDDTANSTTSFSTSVAAANSTSSYQPVNQPQSLSGIPASYTTQHHIPLYIPTRAPVTAANNEATTQPVPNTAPLVSSSTQTQVTVGETPAADSQPTTSSDID